MSVIVVVGAGTAGLTAAWELARAGHSVTVLERNSWIGGRVRAVDYDGVPVDAGAAFVTDFYHQTRALMETVGVEKTLESFPLAAGIPRDGTIRPLQPFPALLLKGPLSVRGLARLALGTLSLARRWRRLDPAKLENAIADDTQTAQAWSGRVYGPEVTDYLIEPLLRGVLHWDARTTSKGVLFSILKALILYPHAYVPAAGLQVYPAALAAGLDVRTNTAVSCIDFDGERWSVDCRDGASTVSTLTADGVVCAVPANHIGTLVPGLNDVDRRFFSSVHYSSTAIAIAALREGTELRQSILFNQDEFPDLAGVTLPAIPEPGRRYGAVRLALSPAAYQANALLSDRELGEFILAIASGVPELSGTLAGARITGLARWDEALPLFDVGHLRRVAQWKDSTDAGRSLVFAGDYLRGPYLEGATRSGLEAAAELVATLQ